MVFRTENNGRTFHLQQYLLLPQIYIPIKCALLHEEISWKLLQFRKLQIINIEYKKELIDSFEH